MASWRFCYCKSWWFGAEALQCRSSATTRWPANTLHTYHIRIDATGMGGALPARKCPPKRLISEQIVHSSERR
jgi:hypothetical protein